MSSDAPDTPSVETAPIAGPAGTREHPAAITSGLLSDWPLPTESGSKDAVGRVLIVGGNSGMPGAIMLAAESAMRAGAGKLQIATAETVAVPLAIAVPEGYVAGLPVDGQGELTPACADRIVELASEVDAVVIGPGFMTPDAAAAVIRAVLPKLDTAVCIDALGLAALTGHLDAVRHLEGRVVLSPNRKELFHTLEREPDDDLLGAALELAQKTGAVVASGAEETFVVTPDGRVWSDRTGGPGLAVSGSGDVKADIIAGLLARGASTEQAATWAVHIHGRVGERLAARLGARGFMARELPEEIPQVLTELQQ